jgi:hypothetical protein
MSAHDFAPLFDRYSTVIDQMPDTFTSHQFILALAHQYQDLYVEALASYRTTRRQNTPTPFLVVHAILSKRLVAFSDLVRYDGEAQSEDIFRQSNGCARWKKVLTASAA